MPPYQARWSELWCGGTAMLWAVYVASMSVPLNHLAAWVNIGQLGSGSEWATFMGVSGLGAAVAALRDMRRLRFAFATALFFGWGALSNGLWLSAMPAPGDVLYAGLSLTNLISLMRVLRRRV